MSGFSRPIPGPWDTYTPTLGVGGGTLPIDYSIAGHFQKDGKKVFFSITIVLNTDTTGTTYLTATLPPGSTVLGATTFCASAGAGGALLAYSNGGANIVGIFTTAGGYPGGSGRTLILGGSYEES